MSTQQKSDRNGARQDGARQNAVPVERRHSHLHFADADWAGLVAIGVALLFAALSALVVAGWSPLMTADQEIVEALTGAASASPLVVSGLNMVTNLGGSGFAWTVLTLSIIWLAIRRERALAIYVALTGLGSAALVSGVKVLADRPRPVLDEPVAAAPGLSFPSGHSLGSTVTYGVLLLVFLPAAPVRLRRPMVAATVGLVAIIGITRIALGVHFPSDVLGGWLLGTVWVLVTAIAFRRWHREAGLGSPPLIAGLEPEERRDLLPAPGHDRPLPHGRHTIAALVSAAVLIWGAVVGIGLLVTEGLPAVRSWDTETAEWFAGIRTPALTDVFMMFSRLGDTSSILVVLLAAIALSFAITRRWRPAIFLIAAAAGEVLLFLASSQVVGRTRPQVEHLTPGLPPTSSFPSGHVAATTALYAALAVLLLLWWRSSLRYLALMAAFAVAVAMAAARMYIGVHYATDAIISIVYASVWVAVCAWVIRPGPDRDSLRLDAEPSPS